MIEQGVVQAAIILLILSIASWFFWRQHYQYLQGQLQLAIAILFVITWGVLIFVWGGQLKQASRVETERVLLTQTRLINEELGETLAQEVRLLRAMAQESTFVQQMDLVSRVEVLALPLPERANWWRNRQKDWQEQIDSTLREAVLDNAASHKLETFRQLFPTHQQLLLIDRYGALVAAAGTIPHQYYYADQPWWSEVSQPTAIYIGLPQVEINHQVTIDIILPIIPSHSNRVMGVLRSRYVLQNLKKSMSSLSLKEYDFISLVNSEGLVLYSSDPLQVGQVISTSVNSWPNMSWQTLDLESQFEATVIKMPFVMPPELVAAPTLDWTILVQYPKSESSVKKASGLLFWYSLLILIMALAASYGLTYWFTRPIVHIAELARLAAVGQPAGVWPVPHSKELRKIAKAIQKLVHHWQGAVDQAEQRLATHTHELEVALHETEGLFKAAQAILGSRDLDTICQNLIIHFNQLVQADQMVLYLVDHEHQTILLEAKHGTIYRETPMTYQELDEGISGLVFRSKQPLISLHLDDGLEPAATRERRRELGIGPLAVVPLGTKDTVIGTITAINRVGHRAFNQHDVDLLMALATQAAAALENVQLYHLAQQELAERKRAELALQKANEELAKINADKDKFLSIMAHDLKAPFMPLLGASDLIMQLSDALTRPQLKQMAEVINASAKNVYSLLDNLLHWARLQQGRMRYKPQSLDLADLVSNIIELLRGNAEAKKINLSTTVVTSLPAYADRYMVETILRNLVSNALKFTPEGGDVVIVAKAIDEAWLEVAVVDTGVGMSQGVKEKLFRIDQHVTTIGTAKEQGTGLGLIICFEMVHQHGGRIWVESEMEQGTTIKFTIPRKEKIVA